jgi:murein DD-endopeptidase MepM/ murein hydrolase activator NlpD
MKRISVYVLAAALIGLLFNFGISYAAKATSEDLSNVNNQINNTQSKLNEGKAVVTKLNKDISSIQNQINNTQSEINSLKGNISATENKINEALAQLVQVEADMEAKSEQLSDRLRIMYKNGGVGVIDVILGSDSISDFMTNMDMVQRIYSSDKEVLQSMEIQHAIIVAQREYLVGLQVQLEVDKQNEAEKQSALLTNKNQVAAKQSEVLKNNKALQEQIDALYAEANRMTKEILGLQGGGDYFGGIMTWPVQGRITSPFGARINPITKKQEFHTGIDIAAKSGTAVLAANSGTIIKAAWNNSYGNMVMVDHGGGIVTLYAHNSALLVKTGDVVSKGQSIAKAGSTGMSTGPHVHFEVRVNGQYKNPIDWL